MTKYDSVAKELAEGRAREALHQRAAIEHGTLGPTPNIYRFVILDAIFDPQIIDDKKLSYWEHDLGVANIEHARVAPRNSVIARRVQNNASSAVEPVLCLYPLFPPALSLPCRPGEHVWVMFEDPGVRQDLGYWMCRIVTANYAEDANHTHSHRAQDPSFSPGTQDKFDGNTEPVYEFRNGSVGTSQGERFSIAETASIPGDETAYKSIMTESDGGTLSKYESIPRLRKRPSDIVLESTSNAAIILGRDRVGPVAEYTDTPDRGKVPAVPQTDSRSDGAAMIDLVVGRGQTPRTGGVVVDNDLPAKELGKGLEQLSEAEGDLDLLNDRSRVLIAQKTVVDRNFGLNTLNSLFSSGAPITDDLTASVDGDGAIVLKSDKIRIVARSDITFTVLGFTRGEDGTMLAKSDPDEAAVVVMKSNGEIVFRPAKSAVLKLGDDDADKAILCTDLPAQVAQGIVSGPPIVSTMGGAIGGSTGNAPALASGQGRYASRVLIK